LFIAKILVAIVRGRRKLQFSKCSQTIFIKPVSEDEIEKETKDLKGKLLAGIDEVPDLIVEECMKFIKKPLTDM
jgi:hypothetical protein